MSEVTEKIYCCDRGDNDNALEAAIIAGNNRRDDIFSNGKTGYLGALGEWKAAYNNKSKVSSAMSLIGGTSFNTSYFYCSSTQHSSTYSWVLSLDHDQLTYNFKTSMYYTRAFCQLSNNQNT